MIPENARYFAIVAPGTTGCVLLTVLQVMISKIKRMLFGDYVFKVNRIH